MFELEFLLVVAESRKRGIVLVGGSWSSWRWVWGMGRRLTKDRNVEIKKKDEKKKDGQRGDGSELS